MCALKGSAFVSSVLAARAGEAAKVIEGTAEPAALPAPNRSPEAALEPAPLPKSKNKPNRLMLEADTEVGPRTTSCTVPFNHFNGLDASGLGIGNGTLDVASPSITLARSPARRARKLSIASIASTICSSVMPLTPPRCSI